MPVTAGTGTQSCSQCLQLPGLGLDWCVLGLPGKPYPVAAGSARADSEQAEYAGSPDLITGQPVPQFP